MRIAVGLSGGVDSAVAALLLKRDGHEVVGVTMKLWRDGRYRGGAKDACFGPGEKADVELAGKFAASFGMEYHAFDCSDEYERVVLDHFRRERRAGRTPNPCVVCNRRLKFGLLPEMASRHVAFDAFATGHYVRKALRAGRWAISRAADPVKDQSYFLWRLSQAQLARSLFPLGCLDKTEVRRIANEAGLPMADKPDSQDFYSGDCNELLRIEDRPGDIVDKDGKILGRHRGYWRYTVGQRQGLGLGGGVPYHVVRIDPRRNEIVVGRREDAICRDFAIRDVNWQGQEATDGPMEGFVKVRSSGVPAGPVVLENGVVHAPGGIFGVAPGQSAVIYSGDGAILCGGTIA